MGIVFRQSIKTSLVIFTGVLLGAVVSYLPAKILPINELGGLRNLINQGAVLQLFFLMGVGSLVHTFGQRYADDDPRRPVLITIAALVPLIVTLLFSVPYLLLQDWVVNKYQLKDRPFMRAFYGWLPVLGLIWSYMSLLELYLASRLKVALSTFMREVVLRLCNLTLIGLFFFRALSFRHYVIGTVLMHAVPVACLLWFSFRTKGFYFSTRWRVFTRKEYYEIAHFSWYHMLTGVSMNLMGFIDALMLGPLSQSGLNDVAIYGFAQFLISVMQVPYRAMGSASFPKLNEAYLSGNKEQLHDLFNRSGLNMLVAAVGMWLIVICNLHNAVAILPGGYEALAPTVLILSAGRVMDMATGLNSELISITRHYQFNFRLSLLLLLSIIIFDRIFIPPYGIFGAAWVSSIAFGVFNLIKLIYLYGKTGLHPFSRNSFRVVLAGTVPLAANFLLPRLSSPWLDTPVRCLLLMGVYGGMLLWLRPSPDMQHYLAQIRKSRRLF